MLLHLVAAHLYVLTDALLHYPPFCSGQASRGETVVVDPLTGTIILSGLAAATVAPGGAASYLLPAQPSTTYIFSEWDVTDNAGVIKLYGPSPSGGAGPLECHWAAITGTGSSRKLTIVTLGGDACGRVDHFECQCDARS